MHTLASGDLYLNLFGNSELLGLVRLHLSVIPFSGLSQLTTSQIIHAPERNFSALFYQGIP